MLEVNVSWIFCQTNLDLQEDSRTTNLAGKELIKTIWKGYFLSLVYFQQESLPTQINIDDLLIIDDFCFY